MSVHVKKGDEVQFLSGRDKKKRGKVIAVSPKEGKVIVEGRHLVTKHIKKRSEQQPGSIVEAEGAVYACKVLPVCPKCDKVTRVGHSFKEADGKSVKVRVCKKCGAEL